MKQISPQELFKCIEELLACDAFELHITPSSDDGLDIYIPYTMFLLRIYEIFPFSFVTRILGYFLNQPGRIKLYQNIYQKIIDASCSYPERSYPDHLAKQIQLERESAFSRLLKL